MKLGEALTLRALQAQKLADLRSRVDQNVIVQEGDNPKEAPGALVDSFETLSIEQGDLVRRINRTNISTIFEGEKTLAAALQDREHLRRVKNVLEQAANKAAEGHAAGFRYMRSEIKLVAMIDVADFRRQIDELIEQIRLLDARIQAVNWQTDLVE